MILVMTGSVRILLISTIVVAYNNSILFYLRGGLI